MATLADKFNNKYYSSKFYFEEWKEMYSSELYDLFKIFNDKTKDYKIKLYYDTFCLFVFNHTTHDILNLKHVVQ
jgi:hypothetical protein